MKIAHLAPQPTPLRGATLPAIGRLWTPVASDGLWGRDARPTRHAFSRAQLHLRASKLTNGPDAAPIPPLYGEGVARRATGEVRPRRENLMANERARTLRKAMTPQEVKLWGHLRRLPPQGFHFRRQAPLEGYILDFVCFKQRLIVEVDGSQHGEEAGLAHDAKRDTHFALLGFLTLRFWNPEIDENLDDVVETIIARAREDRGAQSQEVRHG